MLTPFSRRVARLTVALPLAVLVLVLALAPSAGAADAELKWKFQPNDALKFKFGQKSRTQSKVMGQDVENLNELKLDFTWTVKSVSPQGVAEITQTVEHAETHIQALGQSIDYDSADKKEPEDPTGKALSGVFGAVIGTPYTLKVDPRGVIQDVIVPEKVTQAIEGTPFKAMADAGSVFSSQGVKVMFAQLLPKLPEGTVKEGQALKAETLSVPAGPLKMELTTTGKVATLGPAGAKVETTIDTKMTPAEGVPFKVTLKKQEGNGVYNFDTAAGRLTDSDLKQSFQLTLSVNGQEIEQEISLDAKLSLAK